MPGAKKAAKKPAGRRAAVLLSDDEEQEEEEEEEADDSGSEYGGWLSAPVSNACAELDEDMSSVSVRVTQSWCTVAVQGSAHTGGCTPLHPAAPLKQPPPLVEGASGSPHLCLHLQLQLAAWRLTVSQRAWT